MKNTTLKHLLTGSVFSLFIAASVTAYSQNAMCRNLFDTQSIQNSADTNPDVVDIQALVKSRMFTTWFKGTATDLKQLRTDLDLKPALVKHVQNPQDGFLAKVMMIRQAKHTIDLTYYIFTPDRTGYAILSELKDAIKRGVSVRIMIDSLGSLNPKALTHPELKALVAYADKNAGYMVDQNGNSTNQKASVQAIVFRSVNPLQLATGAVRKVAREIYKKFLSLSGKEATVETVFINPNRRSHDKILITDQNFPRISVAIIGGRNISDHYYGIPEVDASTFKDLEVIVKNDPDFLNISGDQAGITTNIGELYNQLFFHSANRLINVSYLRKLLGFDSQFAKMENAAADSEKLTEKFVVALNEKKI